jgi:hypothetical protein
MLTSSGIRNIPGSTFDRAFALASTCRNWASALRVRPRLRVISDGIVVEEKSTWMSTVGSRDGKTSGRTCIWYSRSIFQFGRSACSGTQGGHNVPAGLVFLWYATAVPVDAGTLASLGRLCKLKVS